MFLRVLNHREPSFLSWEARFSASCFSKLKIIGVVVARFRSGWVKLYRSLLDHPAAANIESLGLIAWLVLSANRETSRCNFNGKLTELAPGSILTSAKEMSDRLMVDERTLRRRLEWLEKCGSIVQQVSNHGRIISLVNWDDYQGDENDGDRPLSDQRRTSAGPAPDQRRHNGEGEKERKREEREAKPKRSKSERKTSWDTGDDFAVVFDNLLAIQPYALIFDREHERKTIQAHMDRHGLTIREIERITSDLRHYCDGLSDPIKSPRGKLNTFVQSFVDRRPKSSAAQVNFKTLEDLMREADQ